MSLRISKRSSQASVVPSFGRQWIRMGRLRAAAISKLADEPGALHFMRRALVVVVEADLAAGDDLRLGQQAVELGENRVVDLGVLCG
jgi:hypothetical protein